MEGLANLNYYVMGTEEENVASHYLELQSLTIQYFLRRFVTTAILWKVTYESGVDRTFAILPHFSVSELCLEGCSYVLRYMLTQVLHLTFCRNHSGKEAFYFQICMHNYLVKTFSLKFILG